MIFYSQFIYSKHLYLIYILIDTYLKNKQVITYIAKATPQQQQQRETNTRLEVPQGWGTVMTTTAGLRCVTAAEANVTASAFGTGVAAPVRGWPVHRPVPPGTGLITPILTLTLTLIIPIPNPNPKY